jgi:MFS family permease
MPATSRLTIAALPALLLGFWLMQTGNTLQGTLLSIRGEIEGFSLAQIGFVGAGFWAGIIVGSLGAGRVIDRIGHIRTFAAFGTVASTAPLVHLLMVGPVAWVLTRALSGFCFASSFIVIESWLNASATTENRGQILSIYSMTGLIAGITGQLLLPASDPSGFKPFCTIASLISFALVPIVITPAAAPKPSARATKINLIGLYHQSSFGVVAGFLGGVTSGGFFTLGPIFAERRGLNISEIALFMASGTLGGFLTAWPLGWLSDRHDRRLVITGAASAAAASLFAMMMLVPISASTWLLYFCAAVFGGMIVPTYSLALAHLSDAVPKEDLAAASVVKIAPHRTRPRQQQLGPQFAG